MLTRKYEMRDLNAERLLIYTARACLRTISHKPEDEIEKLTQHALISLLVQQKLHLYERHNLRILRFKTAERKANVMAPCHILSHVTERN